MSPTFFHPMDPVHSTIIKFECELLTHKGRELIDNLWSSFLTEYRMLLHTEPVQIDTTLPRIDLYGEFRHLSNICHAINTRKRQKYILIHRVKGTVTVPDNNFQEYKTVYSRSRFARGLYLLMKIAHSKGVHLNMIRKLLYLQ